MKKRVSKIFFDKNDYQLLEIVRDIQGRGAQSQILRSLLSENMHPHGIKEMAAERGLRFQDPHVDRERRQPVDGGWTH